MNRKHFLRALGATTLLSSASVPPAPKAQEINQAVPVGCPNILMIVAHDLGQHLGCYGVETVQTPHIDALARQGVRFANMYATTPVCSPARGSLHTGRYPQSNGLMGLTHAPWWWSLNPEEVHTAALLRAAGYETVLAGLQHLGLPPERLGYDRVLSPKQNAKETSRAVADELRQRKKSDRPFFIKAGFTETHRPFRNGSDTSKGVFVPPYLKDTPTMRKDLADFQATIHFFDERVGEMLDALAQSDMAEDTLVVFTADHGIPYPGAKWSIRRAGITIPLILYQPGTALTGGKTIHSVISQVDVLPTLLEWIGRPVPNNIEGVSFHDYLQGKTPSPPRDAAFSQYTPDMKRDNESRSIITDRFHLIRYFDQGRAVQYPVDVDPVRFAQHMERASTNKTRPFAQLFDIKRDPYELNDLSANEHYHPIIKDLSARLMDWMRQVKDPLLKGPLQHPYYLKAMQDFQNTTQ